MFSRIWNDIRANPGVWIGVGLAALLLVVGYLAYKSNQANLASQANTSNTSSGQPLWGTASVGTDPTAQPSNAEILAELASIAQYIQSQQTPNPPGVASPTPLRGVLPIGPILGSRPPVSIGPILTSRPPVLENPPLTAPTRLPGRPVIAAAS